MPRAVQPDLKATIQVQRVFRTQSTQVCPVSCTARQALFTLYLKTPKAYPQARASQLSTVAVHAVHEGQHEVLAHGHEGIPVLRLHVAADVHRQLHAAPVSRPPVHTGG